MAFYEHVFLARQDITAQQAAALQKTYQTVIEENGGEGFGGHWASVAGDLSLGSNAFSAVKTFSGGGQ